MSRDAAGDALHACLDVMLRMIPTYCHEQSAKACSDAEHNDAIDKAACVVYGQDRTAWPKGVRYAAEGRYP